MFNMWPLVFLASRDARHRPAPRLATLVAGAAVLAVAGGWAAVLLMPVLALLQAH